jgi:ATP-binding cassette subfamily B protein
MKGSSIIVILICILIAGVLLIPLNSKLITIGMFMGLVNASFSLVQMMSWELSYVTREIANNKEYLKDLSAFSKLEETQGAADLPDKAMGGLQLKSIEFKDVKFQYPGTDIYILNGLSFYMAGDRHYAFVGVNGAGKTTITKLLTGLYPEFEGEILINGKSIREFSASQLKGLFSVVYQDFAKYYITLRDNIALGNVNGARNDEIAAALAVIDLTDEVSKLEKGLDTPLGKILEGGTDFSGGEWQRVAIARSLVSKAPVHILDEPTAALDPVAESKVYELFGRISKDKMTIFITHRLGAAKLADEILVLKDGKIAEQGSHDRLMEENGIYAEMFEAQRSWYN